MSVWQLAVDRELVLAYLGVAKDDATIEDATRALSELIQWHVDVATDPRVNGGYALVKVEQPQDSDLDLEGSFTVGETVVTYEEESLTDEPLTDEQLEKIRAASSATGTLDNEFDKRLF